MCEAFKHGWRDQPSSSWVVQQDRLTKEGQDILLCQEAQFGCLWTECVQKRTSGGTNHCCKSFFIVPMQHITSVQDLHLALEYYRTISSLISTHECMRLVALLSQAIHSLPS